MVQKMADQLIGASPSQLRTVQSFELNDNDVFTTTSVCVFVFVCCKCDRESDMRGEGRREGMCTISFTITSLLLRGMV